MAVREGGAGVLLAIAPRFFAGRKRSRIEAETNNLLPLYIQTVLGIDYGGGIVEWKTKDQ